MSLHGKTGKLPPKPHRFSLPFDKYLGTELPPPSPTAAWQDAVTQWGMYSNDVCGDCTAAAKAHILMAVTANAGQIVIPSIEEVIAMYCAVSGYDPASGANDNGAAMTDVNAYLLQNGLAGRKILGWVKIDHSNRTHFEQCVELFGACDVGVQLPEFAEVQFDHDQPWELSSNNGPIVGGHDVPYFGYNKQEETCVTWGRTQGCGISWFQRYADEAYGLIFSDWFDTHSGLSPSHFDRDQLWEDLQALKAE